MNYTLEKKEKNTVRFDISFDKVEWDAFNEQAYKETKSKFTVQGFRAGKAPKNTIEKQYGEMVFFETALDIAFEKGFGEVLEKEKTISPISQPSVALNKVDENGISFSVEVEVLPEVKVVKYSGFGIKKEEAKVEKSLIEAELLNLQDKAARFVEVTDEKLENGMFATFDFSGSVEGVKFDGGQAKDYRLEIGSHQFIEGFEAQMIGMILGEEKNINVRFPDQYGAENLAGKDAIFEIKINKIEKKTLPKIDDEFASNSSEFETIEELRADIAKKLSVDAEKKANQKFENDIIEAFVKDVEVEIPVSMVDKQVEVLMQDFEKALSYQGLKIEDYVKYKNTTVEEIKDKRREEAQSIVKTRLALGKLIDEKKLQPTIEDVNKKIQEMADRRKKTFDDMKKLLAEKDFAYLENDCLMDSVIKYLTNNN